MANGSQEVTVKDVVPNKKSGKNNQGRKEYAIMKHTIRLIYLFVGIFIGIFLNGNTNLLEDLRKITPNSFIGKTAEYFSSGRSQCKSIQRSLSDIDELLVQTFNAIDQQDYSDRIASINNNINELSLKCNTSFSNE